MAASAPTISTSIELRAALAHNALNSLSMNHNQGPATMAHRFDLRTAPDSRGGGIFNLRDLLRAGSLRSGATTFPVELNAVANAATPRR